eukprot:gnl/MRDRNA2_/MRDRNA2_15140_c0_seq1.p1 gnl/MRDRNA2_/MRDRNA2_15140_c0~~gnl/MRDRNA2_/MRDRNA2_15140_c0_seq1.p1  ORF type:complete len:454 (+),score=82.66 gnl/MRDRNA2_/MRDRNA2_15140_c0_seq1:49-1362(+)
MSEPQGCPVWVRFLDPVSGLPYFFNVLTQESTWIDPDPEGKLVTNVEELPQPEMQPPGLEDRHDFVKPRTKRPPEPAPVTLPWQLNAEKRCEDHRGTLPWKLPISAVMGRRARKQVEKEIDKSAYVEGRDNYNIWYEKWNNDRFNRRKDREPASYRCDPYEDAGRTEADVPGAEETFFCIYFATGCCNLGSRCRYFHRVPTNDEHEKAGIVKDIFGRDRHMNHRHDMDGVGSLSNECRTLFVSDLRFNRSLPSAEALKRVDDQLWSNFSLWGEIENIHMVSSKCMAFIRYRFRGAAEYAKIAMADQAMVDQPMLSIRWAHDDPRPGAQKRQRIEARRQMEEAVEKKLAGWSDMEKAGLQLLMPPEKTFTVPYPNTGAQDEDEGQLPASGPGTGLRTSMPEAVPAGPSLPSGFMSPDEQAEEEERERGISKICVLLKA